MSIQFNKRLEVESIPTFFCFPTMTKRQERARRAVPYFLLYECEVECEGNGFIVIRVFSLFCFLVLYIFGVNRFCSTIYLYFVVFCMFQLNKAVGRLVMFIHKLAVGNQFCLGLALA